jgi:hypothetical protein
MMHFYRECPIRQRARAANSHHEWLSSDSHTPEDFRELHAKEPTRYCSLCLTIRTDSNRYAELRALVEAYQSAKSYEDDAPLQALRDWSHR